MKKQYLGGLLLGLCWLLFSTSAGAAKQTLNSMVNTPLTTLDSTKYAVASDSEAITAYAEGLYTYDAQQHIVLGVAAKEPTVNRDKTQYTFTLKHTCWSNGQPVIADDFVYAWQRLANPKRKSRNASKVGFLKNGAAVVSGELPYTKLGVKALSKYRLRITLARPTPYLSRILVGAALVPISRTYAHGLGDKYGTAAQYVLANGPFKIQNWQGTHDQRWRYVKNPHYWHADQVTLKSVQLRVVPTSKQAARLFDDNKLDYAELTDQTVQRYTGYKVLHQRQTVTSAYLFFNTQQAQLKNLALRQALAQSFDKRLLVDAVLRNGSQPLNGLIPAQIARAAKNQDYRTAVGKLATTNYDIRAAAKDWHVAQQQLGHKQLTLQLLISNTPQNLQIGRFLQAQMQHTLPGLTVKLKAVSLTKRIQLEGKGQFQMVLGMWTPTDTDPANYVNFFKTNSLMNVSKYHNVAYDRGLARLSNGLASKPTQRLAEIQRLEQQAVAKATVVAPLYQSSQTYLQDQKVHGLQVSRLGSMVNYKFAKID